MADAFQFRLYIAGCGDIAVGQMPEIQLHAGLEAPFQRHFIDPPGWLPARFQGVVHGGEEVVRRVQMGTVMGGYFHFLHRCVFAVRQLIDPDAHVFRHGRGGLVVIQILDLWQHVRRIALDARHQRDGDVDQAARHRVTPRP